MENIHLLATSKPSRLYYFGNSPELRLTKYPNLFRVFERSTQHLYITSDERFKVNEYITDNIEVIKATPKLTDAQGLVGRRNWRKIILTTDTDLIKDGIEVIPDEFIKWFIQNPSCKYVQTIEKSRCCGRCNGVDDLCYTDMCCVNHHVYGCETCYGKRVEYSITIPKVEPNMNKLQKEIFEMEQELGVPSNLRWHNSKPKQEIKSEDIFNDEKRETVKRVIHQHKVLQGLNLVNPLHLEMTSNGHGEFPDGYKLTEKGIQYIIEQLNNY